MKVSSLRSRRVVSELRETFTTAIRSTKSIDAVEITVVTEKGASGVGYATATPAITGDTLESIESFVAHQASRLLVGRRADNSCRMALAERTSASPSGAAGVDLALVDLLQGAIVEPVSVATSVTISAADVATMVEVAHRRVEAGFRTVKAKLGVDPAGDAVRAVAIGRTLRNADPSIEFWIDANQGWDVERTMEIVDTLEKAGISVARLEQPTPAQDLTSLATIRRRVSIPLVADESVCTITAIDEVARLKAADFVNVKLMKFGGLLAAERAIERAREHGLGVLVGSMMEHPRSVAAAVSLAARQPETVHDLDAGWWSMDSAPLTYACGFVSIHRTRPNQ